MMIKTFRASLARVTYARRAYEPRLNEAIPRSTCTSNMDASLLSEEPLQTAVLDHDQTGSTKDQLIRM